MFLQINHSLSVTLRLFVGGFGVTHGESFFSRPTQTNLGPLTKGTDRYMLGTHPAFCDRGTRVSVIDMQPWNRLN